uniref:A-kinase anchor protein 13 n=1 Tax=Pristiophorus japonicus TaxID=55135 RepID=UPI00398EEB82
MKLTPNQAPLYGEYVLSVLLGDEHTVEEDVTLYLLFSGSSQRHLTSTQRVDQNTLQTVAPAHNCCETVKVVLCASKEGFPISVLAEENFQYVQNAAFDMAQFLVSSAGSQEALNAIRIIDNFRVSSNNVALLDKNLTLEVQHLVLPPTWNVLGPDTKLPAVRAITAAASEDEFWAAASGAGRRGKKKNLPFSSPLRCRFGRGVCAATARPALCSSSGPEGLPEDEDDGGQKLPEDIADFVAELGLRGNWQSSFKEPLWVAIQLAWACLQINCSFPSGLHYSLFNSFLIEKHLGAISF